MRTNATTDNGCGRIADGRRAKFQPDAGSPDPFAGQVGTSGVRYIWRGLLVPSHGQSGTQRLQRGDTSPRPLGPSLFEELISFLGTELAVIYSVSMEEPSLRSLERVCRVQAALTTHEATKRALETMAEEYRRQADFQDSQQHKE